MRPAPPHAGRLKPKLSEVDRADLREGVELFNAEKFWEAHEAWERIWQRHTEPWRFFIQGLIQATAAHHQLRRGIQHGTVKHLKNALVKLDAAPPDFVGLKLAAFREYLKRLLAKVEEVDRIEFQAYKNLETESLDWSQERNSDSLESRS